MASTIDDDWSFLHKPIVQAFDWVGFCALTLTTVTLGLKLFNFKPPDKNCLYYFGYNEAGMAALYVNLIASTAYYAKIAAHLSGNPDSETNRALYTYCDYMVTCPVLTLDLLWTLNLPYKMTYGFGVFLTLFAGFMAAGHPYPGRWLWFFYGITLFSWTWLKVIGLVQVRFLQYFSKKDSAAVAQLGDMATASQKHVSMATKAGLRHKDVRNPLKFALGTYFTIWMCYPLLWLLLEGKLITPTISHCCHVVMDVLAKSMYGFALLRFQLLVDKTQVHFTELKVTKAELIEEFAEAKKKLRRIQRSQELQDQESDEDSDESDDEYSQNGYSTGPGTVPQAASPADTQEQIRSLMNQLNNSGQNSPMVAPGVPARQPSPRPQDLASSNWRS